MASDNVLKGLVKLIYLDEIDFENDFLIDVRPSEVFKISTIKGAINIPAEELRAKLNELPKDKRVVLFCHRGFTSYVAARILTQEGFMVYSLSGGYSFYKVILKDKRGIVMNNEPKKPEPLNQPAKIQIDACGMQCPGPILKLADTIKTLQDGEIVEISTLDAGFVSDIRHVQLTRKTLLNLTTDDKPIKALIKKGKDHESTGKIQNGQTIVVFSNDMDKALASFIIANGASASGKPVVMFFTFWGLSLLRKANHADVQKSLIDKMFAFMLPKGAENLALSKMNMFGLGSLMMSM
jgi:rhodanese-related sulfurtransferase/TusA-related sulfurtransferase